MNRKELHTLYEKRRTHMITILVIFCSIYALLCAFGIVSSWARSSRRAMMEKNLQQQGVRIAGRLTGHVSSAVFATYLPFTYEYAEKTYKTRQWVSKQYANVLLVEKPVDILLLSDNPATVMLANISPGHWESRILKRQAFKGIIIFCIVVSLLILLLILHL